MAKTKPVAASAAKKKKKGKNAPAKVAMKARGAAAAEQSNPFEAIWSRRKFDVLGKKRKGEEMRIARSRSEAIRKRENTLLKEFEANAKSSVFQDRRIGERDDSLPEFDKAILRQQRERLAKLKRESKYNLSDDEDELNVHDPHDLLVKDDFDEEVPLDDGSDEEGKMILSKKRLSLQTGDRPSEMDAPEETHAQKAQEREEDERLVDKLDSDFASLAQSQALLSLTESAKGKVNKNDSSTGLSGKEILDKAKADTYVKLVREMVMDQRARPSDRTKTPEEIAQEEKEHLEKLEKERQKRMLGTADSSGEDDDDEDDHHMKRGNSKPISGDDLGDSFTLDESTGKKKGWVDEIYEREGFLWCSPPVLAVLATQSPVKFKIINMLVKPLIEMSAETPYFAAICARERLIHTRTRLCEDIKVPGKSSWPNLKTILLLRLWSLIFPCSDFRHVVATPVLLLIYIKGLDYDPDRERAQLKKLKRRLKSEKKGAMRELRKDNYFLSAVKEKERMKQEQERAEKFGKPWLSFKNRKVLLNLDNWARGKAEKGGDDVFIFCGLGRLYILISVPLATQF
ncbi:hypothetical protein PR202_ga10759 [Eleusine coracana subsp. coracana]|uniref:Nucleolar protein 14 n=1 Tax=Eleusine coracana subsp. coracana TaxID=191504 RepID=A0AAV5C7R7_ELECO|nr:hypothetical protein PR202_ga10759 [Eleusine coracana subsp. coracana]